tara:strand:+ start:110 stop:505 length:396 start_codon:yes stop_codon:yes gene_type:complete
LAQREIKITKNFLILFIILFGIVVIQNVYAKNKCANLKVNFNNQFVTIFKNINSLKTCIKPASKYRLKSCIKRKQEGSKGFNCLPELTKALNSNPKKNCKSKFENINRLLLHLVTLDHEYDFCLKIEKNYE